MSSFGGVNFTALRDGFNEPAKASVTVRGFPGGDNWAITLAGQREVERTVSCLFESRGEYLQFVLLRGRSELLLVDVWDGGPVQAVLRDVAAGDTFVTGQIRSTASFVLV